MHRTYPTTPAPPGSSDFRRLRPAAALATAVLVISTMAIGALPAAADATVEFRYGECNPFTNVATLLGFSEPDSTITDLVVPSETPDRACDIDSIAPYAFADYQLEFVSIPSSVTSIGTAAFAGNNLTEVHFEGATAVAPGAFDHQGTSTDTIWYTDEGLADRWDGTVSGPLDLYRQDYEVHFGTARGGPVDSVRVDHGGTVPQPSDPTTIGYLFQAWEMVGDETPWDFDHATVSEETFLVARWITASYQITFYSNDDVATRPALSITVAHGGTASAPTLQPRDGYTFLNQWNTQPDGSGVLWTPGAPITSDWALYAQWRPNSHLVSFDLNGGKGFVPSQTVDHGRQASDPGSPARDGYIFGGWFTAGHAPWNFAVDSVTGNVQLVAHWLVDPAKPHKNDGGTDPVKNDDSGPQGTQKPGDKNTAKPGAGAPTAGDHAFAWVPDPTITPGQGCKTFPDVAAQHVHCTNIGWLAERGLAKGYSDGSYGADRAVTRGAMVTFLYRMMNPGVPAPACTAKPFRDVEITSEFCGTIQWAKNAGLTYGYADGTFRASADLTRGAMSAFLYRISNPGQQAPACTDRPFQDVDGTSEFCGTIDWAKATGTAFGESTGNYNVTHHTTRGSMATFLHRVAVRLW